MGREQCWVWCGEDMQRKKSHVPYNKEQSKGESWWGRREGPYWRPTEEPYSDPDVHFASGSFGKLPHLVACHEIIREGGKGKPGKEKREERAWAGSTALLKVGLEAPGVRRDKPHPMMDGKNTAPSKAHHCTRLTLGKNTVCPEFCR